LRFEVRFKYDEKIIEIIKKCDGAFFDFNKRVWTIPNQQHEDLTALFSTYLKNINLVTLNNYEELPAEPLIVELTNDTEDENWFIVELKHFSSKVFSIVASLEYRRSWRSEKSSWAFEKKNLQKIIEQIMSKTQDIDNFVLIQILED
jgi:hypothetical protein